VTWQINLSDKAHKLEKREVKINLKKRTKAYLVQKRTKNIQMKNPKK